MNAYNLNNQDDQLNRYTIHVSRTDAILTLPEKDIIHQRFTKEDDAKCSWETFSFKVNNNGDRSVTAEWTSIVAGKIR